jgi:hypothetical protein
LNLEIGIESIPGPQNTAKAGEKTPFYAEKDARGSKARSKDQEREDGDQAEHKEVGGGGSVGRTVAPVVKVAETVGCVLKVFPLHIQLLDPVENVLSQLDIT